MKLKCECGFKTELPKDVGEVVCPICFSVYKRIKVSKLIKQKEKK